MYFKFDDSKKGIRLRNIVNTIKYRRRQLVSNEFFGTVPDDYNKMNLSYSEWTFPFENPNHP